MSLKMYLETVSPILEILSPTVETLSADVEMLSPIGEILSVIWEILSPNFGENLSPERGEFQLCYAKHSWKVSIIKRQRERET